MALRKKVESGVLWVGLTNFGNQFLVLGIQVLLARLIDPEEFGIVATVAIVLAICNVLIDGGFGQALVQKKEVRSIDISSVFYFNLFLSLVLYAILYLASPAIASFFLEPRLGQVLPVLGLALIVTALSQTQFKMLNRNLQFSRLFWIAIPGSLIGGTVGVWMALQGWEVWSIVGFQLSSQAVRSIALWIVADSRFRPGFAFQFSSLREMFPYGAGIMGEGLVGAILANIHGFAIAKLFNLTDLAFYSRANALQILPATLITNTFGSVLFPAIAGIRDSADRSLRIIREATSVTGTIVFPAMLLLIAVAEPLVVALLTDKWLPSVPLLRLLPIVGACYVISGTCLTILRSLGFSGATFGIALLKNLVVFAALGISYRYGLLALVVGQVLASLICLLLNLYMVHRLTGYKIKRHLLDLAPPLLAALAAAGLSGAIAVFTPGPPLVALVSGTACMGLTYISISKYFGFRSFAQIELIVFQKLAVVIMAIRRRPTRA